MRIYRCTSLLPSGTVRQRLEASLQDNVLVELTFVEGTRHIPFRFTVTPPTGDKTVMSYPGRTWDGRPITVHCTTENATLTIASHT